MHASTINFIISPENFTHHNFVTLINYYSLSYLMFFFLFLFVVRTRTRNVHWLVCDGLVALIRVDLCVAENRICLKQYMGIFCVREIRPEKTKWREIGKFSTTVQTCIPSPKYNHSSFVLKNTDLTLIWDCSTLLLFIYYPVHEPLHLKWNRGESIFHDKYLILLYIYIWYYVI